jgi:hypothetical protein
MELSTDWIEDFEIEDKDYKQFYKEPVKTIQVFYLYVNRHQELFHIKKQKIDLSNSRLEKKNLIALIKKYRNYQNKTYVPLSILKYNITLEPQYIQEFILNPVEFKYMEAESSIETIDWFDSIVFLQEVNSLYIVFREKWKTKGSGTKKIYIKSKKLNRTKTRKKRLKDTSS